MAHGLLGFGPLTKKCESGTSGTGAHKFNASTGYKHGQEAFKLGKVDCGKSKTTHHGLVFSVVER